MIAQVLLWMMGCSWLQPSPPPRCVDVLGALVEESEDTAEMAQRVRSEPRIPECMRQELLAAGDHNLYYDYVHIRIIHLYNLVPEFLDSVIIDQMIRLAQLERARELGKGKSIGFVRTSYATSTARVLYHHDKERLAELVRTLGVHKPSSYAELVQQCEETPYRPPEYYVCFMIHFDGRSSQAYPLDEEASDRAFEEGDAYSEEYFKRAIAIQNEQMKSVEDEESQERKASPRVTDGDKQK
ncbi:MAG: hypothetical protein AAFV53_16430 [Myxococcota bacterium]